MKEGIIGIIEFSGDFDNPKDFEKKLEKLNPEIEKILGKVIKDVSIINFRIINGEEIILDNDEEEKINNNMKKSQIMKM